MNAGHKCDSWPDRTTCVGRTEGSWPIQPHAPARVKKARPVRAVERQALRG